MARKSISWILNFTNNLPNDEERVHCLQANDNNSIRTILRFALDPNIKWLLPEGDAPYTPCEYPHQENMLYMEARRLYLFVEGGSPNLKQLRRETMFVELLQVLDPEDARLIMAIKDKNLPYKTLTAELVQRAYPGIF
jgi:Family of unknown function (DUF6433)